MTNLVEAAIALKDATSQIKKYLKNSTKLTISLSILILLVSLVIFEPIINYLRMGEVNPLTLGTFKRDLSCSFEHPLGTDRWGRDLLAVTLIGLKYSFAIGFLSGFMATLIAVVVALTGAWLGGKMDVVLNSITNAVLVVPSFPIVIAISAYARTGLFGLAMLITFFAWPWAARTIRSQALSLKERAYIDLAILSNEGSLEVIFKEILPNLLPYIIVGFSYSVIGAILTETGLRLIGIGVASEIPTLGFILNQAIQYGAFARQSYNYLLPPVLMLMAIFISINLLNAGLDELFNPRLKRITGE